MGFDVFYLRKHNRLWITQQCIKSWQNNGINVSVEDIDEHVGKAIPFYSYRS